MTSRTDRLVRPGLLFRIGLATPVCWWSGVGPRFIAQDAVETRVGGGIYLGLDFPVDLPVFNLLANGTADSVTLNCTGVDDHMVDLVDQEASLVRSAPVAIGMILLDQTMQISRAPYWLQGLLVTKVSFSIQPTGTDPTVDETHTATVSMTLGYGDARRKRAASRYWAPDRGVNGDLGYSNLPLLDSIATRQWPPPGN